MSDLADLRAAVRRYYPERAAPDEGRLERMAAEVAGRVKRLRAGKELRFDEFVRRVNRNGARLAELDEERLGREAEGLRPELRARPFDAETVSRAFALVRELADRRLGLRHYDEQLMGGWALLHGYIVEMRTGEGKTLVATLPACALGLAGIPVHLITVNDYLASRDAEWMGPIYRAVGLSVGVVTHATPPPQRPAIYGGDVTYCTNKDLVFDYLRDRLQLGRKPGQVEMRLARLRGQAVEEPRLRLRGLCFGIVDEADSVLIDEARTPLIISGPGGNGYAEEVYAAALELAAGLEPETAYTVDHSKRVVRLTDAGRAELERAGDDLGGIWRGRQRREDLIQKALCALRLFRRDRHYVVKEGKVQIVDEYTGRVLPGRSWEGGLHQLIEAKECCELTAETEVLGRISYQRFFRRYLALAGMTGTAREATAEFWSVYRRPVVRIPTHRPMILRGLPTRVFPAALDKWDAVVARIAELHAAGRPVLVGTRTVADSERLGGLLEQRGLPFRILNALQDAAEAEIVARAGEAGRITVATNMAGRGTDIKLGPGVAELGGLHVIGTERHDSGRIDRQLFGRAGRQGDPGSWEMFVSLEDELLRTSPAGLWRYLRRARGVAPGARSGRLGARPFDAAQRAAERKHYRARRELLKLDETLATTLAFSGSGE